MTFDAGLRACLESHLVALVLATTGERTDIAATATGYSRAAGSFAEDGFRVGDTVSPTGFDDERPAVVIAVSDAALIVDREVAPEAAGPPVTIAAVLPEARKFEGQPFVRPPGKPWLRAALRHERSPLVAFGAGGVVRHQGSFVVELFQPVDGGHGLARIERLAEAVRDHFRPGGALAGDGLTLRIANSRRGGVQEARDQLSLAVTVAWSCDRAG